MLTFLFSKSCKGKGCDSLFNYFVYSLNKNLTWGLCEQVMVSIIYPLGMNRKRALISDTFKVKKRRNGTEKFGAVSNEDGGCDC